MKRNKDIAIQTVSGFAALALARPFVLGALGGYTAEQPEGEAYPLASNKTLVEAP